MTKSNHVVIHREGALCTHCGTYERIPMPQSVYRMAALLRSFEWEHRYCPKTWIRPTPQPSMSLDQKIEIWLEWGYTGISSKTMLSVLTGKNILPESEYSHPLDWADFRRCYLLVEAVPELRASIDKMAEVSSEWAIIVHDWDKLIETLLRGMASGKVSEPFPIAQGGT